MNWRLAVSFDQLVILLTGVPAIYITQCAQRYAKWAPILGLIGQPFWIYSSLHTHSYGMVGINCLYTLAWARGIFTYWIQPWRLAHVRTP